MLINLLLVIVFLTGLGIFLYPTISDIYGKYRDSKLMTKYSSSVKSLSKEKKEKELKAAIEYNESLRSKGGFVVSGAQYQKYTDEEEKEQYEKLLATSSQKIMGILDIPAIAVSLPLYHWSTDSVLDKGVGHIHGSSLPVGMGISPEEEGYSEKAGSHTVFIAHRGLPSSKLFSDLDEMDIGDMFYVKVLGETLAYKVYSVDVVLPTEVESLKIEKGRDLCTLITCTPYGVNTHRILVKGERVEYKGEKTVAPTSEKIKRTVDPKTVLGVGIMVFAIFLILWDKKQRKKGVKPKGEKSYEDTEKTSDNGNEH